MSGRGPSSRLTVRLFSTTPPEMRLGLRSTISKGGSNGVTSWANGFVEILPAFPDYNFDGLDDRFQRRYFPLFTQATAAPTADPDGDGVVNALEYFAGTDPTKATSRLRLDSGGWRSGSDLAFQLLSAPGKLYVLESTPTLINPNWTPVITNLGDGTLTTFVILALMLGIPYLKRRLS